MRALVLMFASVMVAPPLAAQTAAGAAAQSQRPPLNRAALAARLQGTFAKLDIDRDGQVSVAEVKAELARRTAETTRKAAIRSARRAALFSQLDGNRDNVLSQSEFLNVVDGQEGTAKTGQGKSERPAYGPSTFKRADRNRDGALSLIEITTDRLTRFDRADVNRDGVLSIAEQAR